MSEQEPNGADGESSDAKAPEANVPVTKGRHSNRRGPKPCLDEARKDKICAIVSRGMTLQTAADNVGVTRRTVYRTAERDAEFGRALREARSRCEIRLILKIEEAAMEKGYWRAAAWLLSRCFRDRYSPRPVGVPVEQVRDLFQRFREALLTEVRTPEDRERVETRLRQIAEDFTAAANANKRMGQDS